MNRDAQIDLVYDALMDLGRIECDCNRVIDPSRNINRADVMLWLEKRHVEEVKIIAQKYMPTPHQSKLTVEMKATEVKCVSPGNMILVTFGKKVK